MVKIDARTKVNDVGYNPGASDHVISYVESLDNMSPDDTAPLVKTHPKAILHASSDPPPQQDQHKRNDLLTVAGNSSQFELRTDDIGLTVSNPSMFALFEQPEYSLDAAPLFILHTEMSNHNARKRTKLRDTAICICALAFSTTISPRRWDRELLNLIVEDAAGVEATILQHTKKEDCSMDQLPQNVNITFESLHSGPQSLRLGIKQIISGSLTSLGSAPPKDCLRTTHSDLNDLLTALKLTLKLHSSIGAVMWCADTVYAVMRVRYNKVAQYKEGRVVLVTITQTDLIMEIFESLCGCVTFITSLFDTPESFQLLPIYKYTSSLHHLMRYFKMSK